jgi:phospholipid transport system substrate-binding protein
MSRLRSICAAFVFALALAPTAVAPVLGADVGVAHAAPGKAGPGTQAVKKANDTIAGLLKQKPAAGSPEEKKLAAKVTTSVREFLDVDELGKRALTDHWAKITPAQQTEFLRLLRALIEDNYVKGLRANVDYQVVYTGEDTRADGATLVKTEIKTQRRGRPLVIKVDYVLVSIGGGLRATDVVTDGVGLVENYRAQFNKIIAKDGFDGLLAKMKKKQEAGG